MLVGQLWQDHNIKSVDRYKKMTLKCWLNRNKYLGEVGGYPLNEKKNG